MKFNYETFKAMLERKGSESAVLYYSHCFESNESDLRDRLNVISELEKDYGVLGVSVMVKPGERLQTSEGIDYIVSFICKAVDSVRNKNEIPLFTA
jgi:hypothetical protein